MTWTGQNFSVGQKLTANQMNNLQNDITAVANGDSGAPRLKGLAMVQPTASDAAVYVQGNYGGPGSASVINTTLAKLGDDIYCPTPGVYSVRMYLYASADKSGGQTTYGRIYVSGVAAGTQRSVTSLAGTPNSAYYNEDITVTAGQLIQIYGYISTSVPGGGIVLLNNLAQDAATLIIPGSTQLT